MENTWKCMRCGRENPAGNLDCLQCGYSPGSSKPEVSTVVRGGSLHAQMLKEVRSWGVWSLVLGAVHLGMSQSLSAPWGILLLLVGAASFYFREAAMFVVYSVALAWAAIGNVTSGQVSWVVLAVVQFVLAVRVFGQFTRYRAVRPEGSLAGQEAAMIPPAPDRAEKVFPLAGCLLGGASLAGFVLVFVGGVAYLMSTGVTETPEGFGYLEGLLVTFGVLGLAMGLASLLSGFGRRVLPIGGMVAGGLVLLLEIGLSLVF